MRLLAAILLILSSGPGWATDVIIKDGGTLQLGGTIYKLDGIDAPDFDQVCVDEHADPWACGVEARDRLTKLVEKRDVRCDDLGPDPAYSKRRIGICRIDGEPTSLNQLMVREGYALNFEPSAKDRFRPDEAEARDHQQGLWKGCFAAPQEFRHRIAKGALLGASCRSDRDSELRAILFPDDPAMPPGCAIKAKISLRARVTGNVGVYHLQGCRSYAALTKPSRWFCSEDDAQAAGFRRAYNCRAAAAAR
jgi:endonuclease YncB( thermonuclease family)